MQRAEYGPQRDQVLTPKFCVKVTLFEKKRIVRGMIKDFEVGRLPWIIRWVFNAITSVFLRNRQDFPGGPVIKNLLAKAGTQVRSLV